MGVKIGGTASIAIHFRWDDKYRKTIERRGGKMAEISIIIPVYNTEKFLRKCLDSVLHQTLTDIEIICVDDGSTDGCSRILDSYAAYDCRIKVIHKENAGLVAARKTGLTAAAGKYIGYVDSDDWIEPTMYEKLYGLISEKAVDVAMCGRYEESEKYCKAVYHGFDEGRYGKAELCKRIYPNMIVNRDFFEWGIFPGVWDKLFCRKILEKNQMAVDERLRMGEDAACVYPCLLQADSIFILHECLYHYRQTDSSMVKSVFDTALERQGFHLLYHSVLNILSQYKNTFNLNRQWKDYLLFLMIPRADRLYLGMEKLDYLFPFPNVKKGSHIIIYGMGTYGQFLYKFLVQSHFCVVEAVADRNYAALKEVMPATISAKEIGNYKYDAIVITASFYKVRMGIYKELSAQYPQEKIHMMDEGIVQSESTMMAFGLA